MRNIAYWVFSVLVSLLVLRELEGLMADDGFIYWRVARNFADHGDFAFNRGFQDEVGVTSILYTLILSAGRLLHKDMWSVTIAIYSLALATTSLLLIKIGNVLGHKTFGFSAAAIALTSPWFLSTRGLESPIVILLLTCLVYAYISQRFDVLGVLIGIVPIVRLDAALLSVLLIAALILRDKREALRQTILFAVPSVVFSLVITFVLTGAILPNTLSAKMAQGRSGFWGNGFQYAKGIWKMPEAFNFNWWFYSVVLLAFAGLGFLLLEQFEYRDLLLVCVLFGVGHYVTYAFMLRTPVYHWYYVSEVWSLVLLAAFGFARIIETARSQTDGLRLGLGLALALSVGVFGLAHIPTGYSYKGYDEAGDWIRRNSPKTATVASAEIGVIGWTSRRTVIDFLGLLDVDSVRDLRNKDLKSWIYRTKPDFFVTHEPKWHFEVVADEPWFAGVYELALKGANGVNVYKRVGEVPDKASS